MEDLDKTQKWEKFEKFTDSVLTLSERWSCGLWVNEGGSFSLTAPFQRVRLNTSLEMSQELFLDLGAMKMRKFGREKEFRLRKFERKRSNGEEMKER